MGSAATAGAGEAHPDEFRRERHGVYSNGKSGSDLIIVRAMVIKNHGFLLLHCRNLHGISKEDISKSLQEVFTYGLHVWDYLANTALGKINL